MAKQVNKFYVESNLTHKIVHNHGEVEQFYIEGDHMPIVEREDFERAQRRYAEKKRQKIITLTYHGIIVCGYCGSAMFIKRYPKMTYYICKKRKEKRDCICKRQREDTLNEAVLAALQTTEFDPFVVVDRIAKIQIFNDKIIIELKDGRVSEWQKQ